VRDVTCPSTGSGNKTGCKFRPKVTYLTSFAGVDLPDGFVIVVVVELVVAFGGSSNTAAFTCLRKSASRFESRADSEALPALKVRWR
jgi:hypothetical protein